MNTKQEFPTGSDVWLLEAVALCRVLGMDKQGRYRVRVMREGRERRVRPEALCRIDDMQSLRDYADRTPRAA